MCSCKNEARVANFCNYKLNRDIEKNPGPPTYVDPNKIVVAPYSQGKELVLNRVQDNNVLQWICVLWFIMTHKGSAQQMILYK